MKRAAVHLAGDHPARVACGARASRGDTAFARFVTCHRCRRTDRYRVLARAEVPLPRIDHTAAAEIARMRALLANA